jgi:hypothetical protein
MLPKCKAAVLEAAKAAGKKAPTAAQLDDIESRLSAAKTQLAREDISTWRSMTSQQRDMAAASRAMEGIRAEAAKKLEQAELQIQRTAEVETRLQAMQESRGERGRVDALSRDAQITDRMATFERKAAMGRLMSLIEASTSKEGASLGRKALMTLFDAENPKMTGDIVREIFKAADGSSGNAMAQKAARAWLDTIEELRTRFNAAGGDVGKLDYGYTPQPHDTSRIRKAGKDAWVEKIAPGLDRSRYLYEDGMRMSDDDLKEMLGKVYDTLSTDGVNKMEPGKFTGSGKRANRGSDPRQIHFADGDAWVNYMREFGRGTIYDAMMGHVAKMTRDITLVERYGPDMTSQVRLQLDMARKADSIPGSEPLTNWHTVDPETYFKIISGEVGMPKSEALARTGAMVRNFQTAAKLGGAVVSSVTDLGTLAITAGYNKLGYWQVLKDIARQGTAESREFMATHGMIADSIADNLNRWSGDHIGVDWSGKMSNAVMRFSLMNAWTDGLRQGFTMTMNASIAKMAKTAWGQLDEFDRARLSKAGITEADWAIVQQAQPAIYKGRELITPQGIKDITTDKFESVRPQEFEAIREKIRAQTEDLSARNAKDQEWIKGRLDKFDDARDSLNRWVKERLAKRLDKNEEETAPMLERMSLLDAQREQAKLQADIESDYNKLFTQADVQAFERGLKEAAVDLARANKGAISEAEKIGRKFGAKKAALTARMKQLQSEIGAGKDAEPRLVKMSAADADIERAALEADIAAAFKTIPAEEQAVFKAALDAGEMKSSIRSGMRSAETIGRRYGEAKGRLERRMIEIEQRIAKMDREANRAADADARIAQKKADDMAAELRAYIERSQERQSRRQYIIDKLTASETPKIEAAAANIKNEVAAKVFGFINDEAEFAVINPDLTTRAVMTAGGQQAGTIQGELIRTTMQFKSFPAAMITRHWRRIAEMDKVDGAPAAANRIVYGTALLTTLIGLGAIATQAKQILAGKDPIDMTADDSTGMRFWAKATMQGGGLSILGDLFLVDPSTSFGDQAGNFAKNALGPTVGSAADLALKNIAGNIWEASLGKDTHWEAELANWAKSNTPGASLWWIKPMLDRGIMDQFNEAMSPGYLSKMKARAQRDWRQGFWWAPGQTSPDRAPDLSAVNR